MVEPMKAPIPARRAVLLRAWSAVVLMTAPMGSVDQRKGGVGAGLWGWPRYERGASGASRPGGLRCDGRYGARRHRERSNTK
ncbi:hypothetical protein GCM10010295_26250 [Streptomyces intermedius]